MKISDILSASDVMILDEVSSKRQLLQDLTAQATKSAKVDARILFDIVWERENLGSTALGKGVALPHGRIPDLKRTQALFAKVKSGVDFDEHNTRTDLVFMLLSPENSGADHLEALSKISGIIRNEAECSKLRQAKTATEIYNILTK